MDSETEMAAARAYVADLRSGRTPPRWQPPTPPDDEMPAELGVREFAGGIDLELAAQPLELLPTPGGLDLRDASGAHVFGRLADSTARSATAQTSAEVCRFAIEHTRPGWRIVARSAKDDRVLAAYFPGWVPAGGDIWVAPGHRCVLRWTPLARLCSWRLTDADHEILRLRSSVERYDIVTADFPTRHVLLVLFVAWVVMAESDNAYYNVSQGA